MSRRDDDSDFQFENIRPGNIDDIFEDEDGDIEVDTGVENDDVDEDTWNAYVETDGVGIGPIEDDEDYVDEEEIDESGDFDPTAEIIDEENHKDDQEDGNETLAAIVGDDEEYVDVEAVTEEEETEPEEPVKEEVVEERPDGPPDSRDEYKMTETDDDERDTRTRKFLHGEFISKLDLYYKKYKEIDLINYVEQYIDKDNNREIFKDMFNMNYAKYSLGVDFTNPYAKQDLWVLVAGLFADEIEFAKSIGAIESEVVKVGKSSNVDIVEDPSITELNLYKRSQEEKYSKTRLDRTVFHIADSTEEENCSIFDDKKTLDEDFYESEFYKIHKQVMTSDRLADMSKVFAEITISEESSYIPIIDYSTGIRVICIDTSDANQFRLNPMLISKKVPFNFKGFHKNNIKIRILYSDDAKARPVAVVFALKKLIGYKYIKPRYKIKLSKNYVVAYTTETKWINMFEQGDLDSKQPENCPSSTEKPTNMSIGVIILDKKSDKDKRSIRRNQVARDMGQYENISADDYNIKFVLSAHVVKNDLRLRNPALPRQERYVEYLITGYTEANPVIISDGLLTILTCIIKEHKAMYEPGTPYGIAFRFERDGLVSPAVVAMLDERDGLEPAAGERSGHYEIEPQFILPPSRKKMEGVFDFEKLRVDKMFFSPSGVQRKYDSALWRRYDLSTRDGRFQFIRSRGFDEFWRIKPIAFDVVPSSLFMLESSDMLRDIVKVSIPMLSDRNSADSEAILFKQSQLNYSKAFGDSTNGKFQMFLMEAFDSIVDAIARGRSSEK